MERKNNVYGVMLTSIEEMQFMKYINQHNIAMNTKQKEERKHLVLQWLCYATKNKNNDI